MMVLNIEKLEYCRQELKYQCRKTTENVNMLQDLLQNLNRHGMQDMLPALKQCLVQAEQDALQCNQMERAIERVLQSYLRCEEKIIAGLEEPVTVFRNSQIKHQSLSYMQHWLKDIHFT